jgi:hypothetical protein
MRRNSVMVLAIGLVLLVGAFLFVARDSTVALGDLANFPGSRPAPDGPGVVYDQRAGESFTFSVSLRQEGALGVSGISSSLVLPFVQKMAAEVIPSQLSKGEQTNLKVTATFGACPASGADAVTITSMPVSYRVGFLQQTSDVELPGPIRFNPC